MPQIATSKVKHGHQGTVLSVDRVQKIGERMREAREICRLTQVKAARLLGYQNSSKLSRLESGADTSSVPIWLIIKAASLYDVSADYLLGISNEFDADSDLQRGMSFWIADALERTRLRDLDVLRKLHKKVSAMECAIAEMLIANTEVEAAMARFATLNPDFEDMRAGSRLVSSVERATSATHHAKNQMQRFKVECTIAASDTSQLSLML